MTAPNWKNRTMWTGDNLDVMRGLNSETVDLIYLDPPFNSNRDYASIGSKAAGPRSKTPGDEACGATAPVEGDRQRHERS